VSYTKPASFDDLPRLLPGAEVLLDGKAIEPFASDRLGFRGRPGAVVRPRSTEQVAALLALSRERGFAVVPRAAATNLCGSVLPRPDAVIVDMTAMNRVVSVDEESLRAVVEPGVINAALQERLAPHGRSRPSAETSRPTPAVRDASSTASPSITFTPWRSSFPMGASSIFGTTTRWISWGW
jgi:FAD/FMN-containing dehydrogenase